MVKMMGPSIYDDDLDSILRTIPNGDRLRGKKILITGAGGLICSAIVDYLCRLNETSDYAIQIYIAAREERKIKKRFGSAWGKEYFEYLHYDAHSPIEFDVEVDYIIHGAGNASPALYVEQPVETMTGNFIGLLNLLDYARTHDVQRLLYISSSEVYGRKTDLKPYRENDYGFVDVLNFRSCYPSAKRASETLCVAYGEEYGVDTVIARPGHVYGPTATRKDNRISSLFAYNACEGKEIVLKSSGKQKRSYCYVVDCVSALLTILCKGNTGCAYNISNKASVITIKEMAQLFANAGKVKLVMQNPTEQDSIAFNPMDNASLNSEKLEQLGWCGQFDAIKGIEHTVKALKYEKQMRSACSCKEK